MLTINRFRAWLTVMGAFFTFFCSVGFLNAFGVFQEHYESHQLRNHSSFDISWIGSFSTFALFSGAPIAGILVDRIGPRVCKAVQEWTWANRSLLGASRIRQPGNACSCLHDFHLPRILSILSCTSCATRCQHVLSLLPSDRNRLSILSQKQRARHGGNGRRLLCRRCNLADCTK